MSQATAEVAICTAPPAQKNAVFTVSSPVDAERLPKVVQRMLPLFNGQRTLNQVCAEAQISVSTGRAVVKKLSGMGILRPVAPARARSKAARFNDLDEEFFASEVVIPEHQEDEFQETRSERVGRLFNSLTQRLRPA